MSKLPCVAWMDIYAGAGRELHEQGEESGAVRDGLEGEGARGARRHGRREVPDLYDR